MTFQYLVEQLLNEGGYDNIPADLKDINKIKDESLKEILLIIFENFESLYGKKWKDTKPLSLNINNKGNFIKLRYAFNLDELNAVLIDSLPEYEFIFNKNNITIFDKKRKICTIGDGEGSRTKKAGGGKAGMDFEVALKQDIEDYQNGEKLKFPEIISELSNILSKDYKKDLKTDNVVVEHVGGKNTLRKPFWDSSNGLQFKIQGNIGEAVADLRLLIDNIRINISLKYTKQFYLTNASIKNYLHLDKIEENVEERNEIIKYFGFNPTEFCTPYGIISKDNIMLSSTQIKKNWAQIITRAIGYGYIYIIGGSNRNKIINVKKEADVKITEIKEIKYANEKRKYSLIALTAIVNGHEYNFDCQFRGTTSKDKYPIYLRILDK